MNIVERSLQLHKIPADWAIDVENVRLFEVIERRPAKRIFGIRTWRWKQWFLQGWKHILFTLLFWALCVWLYAAWATH